MNYDPTEILNRKTAAGKRQWSAAPLAIFRGVADAMAYGARKYGPHNWRAHTRSSARDLYVDAILRHLDAWQSGEETDPESGMSHLDHVAASAIILRVLTAGEAPLAPEAGP